MRGRVEALTFSEHVCLFQPLHSVELTRASLFHQADDTERPRAEDLQSAEGPHVDSSPDVSQILRFAEGPCSPDRVALAVGELQLTEFGFKERLALTSIGRLLQDGVVLDLEVGLG